MGYSPIVAPYSGPPAQIFYGTVKSFNEDKGWGHITCAETQAIYGKDMFVLRSALAGVSIKAGDTVSFGVQLGALGPEANSVTVVGQASADVAYTGTIKQWSEDKGWGFIECDQTWQVYAKDIFLHKNELRGYIPQLGEPVQFTVQMGKEGRPQAANLNFMSNGFAAIKNAPISQERVMPF